MWFKLIRQSVYCTCTDYLKPHVCLYLNVIYSVSRKQVCQLFFCCNFKCCWCISVNLACRWISCNCSAKSQKFIYEKNKPIRLHCHSECSKCPVSTTSFNTGGDGTHAAWCSTAHSVSGLCSAAPRLRYLFGSLYWLLFSCRMPPHNNRLDSGIASWVATNLVL